MKKGYQKDKTLARGNDVYVWIDVHKENWHVAVRVDGVPLVALFATFGQYGNPKVLPNKNHATFDRE